MSRLIDFVFLRIIIFLCLVIAVYSLTGRFLLSVLAALAAALIGSAAYGKLISSRIKKRRKTADALNGFFTVKGNAFAAEYIAKRIDPRFKPRQDGDFILSEDENGNGVIIFPVFKFSKISKDEFLKMFRTADARGIKKLYIISKTLDRDIYLTANGLDAGLVFVRTSALYKFLKAKGALPEIPAPPPAPKKRVRLRLLLEGVFCDKNSKRFLLTTVVLLASSFLTPLKAYYYTMSAISTALALLCFLVPSRPGYSRTGIFETDSRRGNSKNRVKK
ncbi:MAG: hypothetical protein LBQ40_02405 [Clostridiales bacterium]|nr:hypothetical protein [Clostridiales bacterium]